MSNIQEGKVCISVYEPAFASIVRDKNILVVVVASKLLNLQ